MHVLFVHQNYPAQFGHFARWLVRECGWQCTFISERPAGVDEGVERITYKLAGGARAENHFCSRTFENAIWHTDAVYEALAARPDIRPDLVVGHSGFGSTLFLRELYDCPIVNYFEWFYRPHEAEMSFRPDFPSTPLTCRRARARNAMVLLDLDNCTRGYSPTHWQRSQLPREFLGKVDVIFDGIDLDLWRPGPPSAALRERLNIPAGARIVTYAARGFESMRGFDIFMRAARELCLMRPDVYFVVVGEDKGVYGGDDRVTGKQSFGKWVTSQAEYDLSRFRFVGRVPPADLAEVFRLGDLHIYLTVPFVLSWSMVDALACGAVVLASGTEPVREVIAHGETGLLADFFDVDAFVAQAAAVLDNPATYRPLGQAARALVEREYSTNVCFPRLLELYGAVV